MEAAKIQSFSRVVPMIYAYNTPGVSYHEGWTKIGYTEKQTVSQRIKQQTHTAGIKFELAWQDNAMFKDGSGEYFTDHDFHAYLESTVRLERERGTEWFHVDGPTSHNYFSDFAQRKLPGNEEKLTYALREEQQEAVSQTRAYFESGGGEFLWNAKPRFGKTLTSYDLVQQMGFTKVLIVTNRPSIANSWAEDFFKFIGWQGKYAFVAPAAEEYGVKKGTQTRLEKQVEQEIDRTFQKVQGDYQQQARIAQAELERKQKEAITAREIEQAESDFKADMDDAMKTLMTTIQDSVEKTIQEKPQEVVEQLERHKAEQEKKSVEEEVRDHLRGFSRTIPSFIMAYGDGNLTLANFDAYTEANVFLEVTGITIEDFRFLRDGGKYTDPETGESMHFEGHLFDEVVFNDSVEEFWNKKQQLANYFDESHKEDIFDYIPPQKTNQIFTPRWVVSMMVDQLEENNPGCFDDPDKTFADLYMKSGLYITEIVKRLYRSEGLKAAFPDEKVRICHILQKQVYGMAPTRIIYLIATNYILGFDEKLKDGTHNFVHADAAEAAKVGALEELVDFCFGNKES